MSCVGFVKRSLARMGLIPDFTNYDVIEAKTDDLVQEREKTLNELSKTTERFKQNSADFVESVGRRKNDLETVLDHLKQATIATADARSLIEQMMRQKRSEDRRK